MNKRIVLLGLCLCIGLTMSACSKKAYEPFQPLSRVTMLPEREAALASAEMAAESGNVTNADATGNAGFSPTPTEVNPFDNRASADFPVNPNEEFYVDEKGMSTPVPPTSTPAPTQIVLVSKDEDGTLTYTMQPGDTLECLARRFDYDLIGLMKVNNLDDQLYAVPGSKIIFPNKLGTYNGQASLMYYPTTYVTKEGDTIFSIACLFGNAIPEIIAEKNNLSLDKSFHEGEKIYIPSRNGK